MSIQIIERTLLTGGLNERFIKYVRSELDLPGFLSADMRRDISGSENAKKNGVAKRHVNIVKY